MSTREISSVLYWFRIETQLRSCIDGAIAQSSEETSDTVATNVTVHSRFLPNSDAKITTLRIPVAINSPANDIEEIQEISGKEPGVDSHEFSRGGCASLIYTEEVKINANAARVSVTP